jgi:mannose-6-phosphate isomerase-like protein (cupin superfamily)
MAIIKKNYLEGVTIDTAPTKGLEVSMLMDGEVTQSTKLVTCLRCVIDPGCQINPVHSHTQSDEISYVVSGEGRFWIDEETCDVKAGDLVLQPINSKHTVKNIGDQPLILLCFHTSPHIRAKGRYQTHEEIKPNL